MQEQVNRGKQKGKIVVSFLLLLLTIACLYLCNTKTAPLYQETKNSIKETSYVVRQISDTSQMVNSYQSILDSAWKQFGVLTIEQASHITFLGETATENGLKINKMTVGELGLSDDLYTLTVNLELQGGLFDITSFIHELYASEVMCRINSISYRLQQVDESGSPLPWMQRTIDSADLLSWWTLSTANGLSSEALELLTADSLMQAGTALCYLEIEFLGLGG